MNHIKNFMDIINQFLILLIFLYLMIHSKMIFYSLLLLIIIINQINHLINHLYISYFFNLKKLTLIKIIFLI